MHINDDYEYFALLYSNNDMTKIKLVIWLSFLVS